MPRQSLLSVVGNADFRYWYKSAGPEVIRCRAMDDHTSKYKSYMKCKIVPSLNKIISGETATSAIFLCLLSRPIAVVTLPALRNIACYRPRTYIVDNVDANVFFIPSARTERYKNPILMHAL